MEPVVPAPVKVSLPVSPQTSKPAVSASKPTVQGGTTNSSVGKPLGM